MKTMKLAGGAGGVLAALLIGAMLGFTPSRGKEAEPATSGSAQSAGIPQTNYSERILAAARAGDGAGIQKIIEESFKGGPGIGEQGATQMLDSLLQGRELKPFEVLLEQLRQTNQGKDWQPSDALLDGIVKDGRTDFLDALLAERLDLKRLAGEAKNADAATAAWITRRVAEVGRERAGMKSLVDACAKGNLKAATQLLDAGVDVNGRMSDGSSWTPLTRAAAANQMEIVKLLLARGAKVDLVKFPGWDYTPLCLTTSVDVANVLKAAGANIHANLFRRNTSILTYVAEFNGAPMVQWFLDQGLDPKMIGDNDETLLFEVKDAATAEILLKAGVDPNRPNEFGGVPLQEARSGGVAEALIKGGAKLTGMKRPLLAGMMQFSSADAVEAVLKAGAPHDRVSMQRALIAATHMDQDKTVEVLLKYGADPNTPGEWSGPDDTMLPLEVCCVFGSVKSAKVLLAHGADPNAGKKFGGLLSLAISNRYKDLAEVLKKAGAKGSSDLAYAIATGDAKEIGQLRDSAPTFHDQPEYWRGVLSAAAERGELATVMAAVQKGVPIVTGSFREDGYYSAASEGQWEVLDYLLHQRAPKSDPKELSEAMWAAVWNSHPYENQRTAPNFEKCVQMLIDAGARVEPAGKPKAGKPDYNLVVSAVFTRNPGGNPRVIEMLAAAGANPNPEVEKGKHLMDAVSESCKTRTCSTPNEAVISTLQRLASARKVAGKD